MKIKEFQKYMREKKIDLSLFMTRKNMKDFNLHYFAHTDVPRGVLLIPNRKDAALYLSVLEHGSYDADVKIELMDKRISETVKKRYRNIKRIGINKDIITLNGYTALKKAFPGASFVDVSKVCRELRETKTDKEIRLIKKAASLTDDIAQKMIKRFKRFKSEKQIFDFLADETRKVGCTQSWDPIVASGKNAAVPHHKPTNMLNKGFCIIDFGLVYKGYNSDMTRTVYIGEPTKKELGIYHHVLTVQRMLVNEVSAGMRISALDKMAHDTLGEYDKYFNHLIGHGVGTKVWEYPQLLPDSSKRLLEDSVITIEPGVYIKGKLGIRIEDDILIKKEKSVRLTKTPKDLVIIKS